MSLARDWTVKKRLPAADLDALGVGHPLLAQLLHNRGVRTPAEARAYLSPCCDDPPDDDGAAGLRDALARLGRAIDGREPVVVYGDYDVDGLSGATLLAHALRACGADVRVFIPNRERDGYGLNAAILDRLADDGARLVVTVDCGVSGVAEVALAASRGLDVVVTDHHEPPEELPVARAIVNPRLEACPFPFKHLAGAGVALLVARALVRRRLPAARWDDLDDRLIEWAALGTVADIVPLGGLNRAIVHRGLAIMNARPSPGLRGLFGLAGVAPGEVTATTLGFVVAPRLNAPGRIADATVAHRLLAAETEHEARALADEIEAVNARRREMLDEQVVRARAQVDALGSDLPPALVLCGDYNPGLLGLLATRLAEEWGRPVAVLSREGDVSRGSVRGRPGFDTIGAVRACHDLLDRYGGHHGAAGLTLPTSRLADFERAFIAAAEVGLRDLAAPPPEADCRLRPETVCWELLDVLDRLEPCGESNAQPLFSTDGLYVHEAKVVKERHVRLTLAGPGARLAGITFNAADDAPRAGTYVDLLYKLRRNVWRDRRSAELEVVGWRPAAR